MSALNVERSREKIALSRDAVQKKTFTKWINSHLAKTGVVVEDLYFDLRDGRNLIQLLEMLTDTKLPREKGSLRFHKLQDLNTVLGCLERRKIDTINITNTDILDGNSKLTLGLVWRLILHFQISTVTVPHAEEGVPGSSRKGPSGPVTEVKQVIIKWCRAATQGYPGVSVDNFSTSWKDGLAFNAILNRFRPDMVDFDSLHPGDNMANLQQAFSAFESEFGVIQLLDAEDFNMAVPDENSILTYISLLIKALPENIPAHPKYAAVSEKWKEYESLATELMSLVTEKMAWLESTKSLTDIEALKAAVQEAGEFQRSSLPVWAASKDRVENIYSEIEEINGRLDPKFPIQEQLAMDVLDEAWAELLQAFDENVQLWNKALESCEENGRNEQLQVQLEQLDKLLVAQVEAVKLIDELTEASKDSTGARERLEEVQIQLQTIEQSVRVLNERIETTMPGISGDDSFKQRTQLLNENLQGLKSGLQERMTSLDHKSAAASEYTRKFTELSIWLQGCEEGLASAQWSSDTTVAKKLLEEYETVHAEIVSKGDAVHEFCSREIVPGQADMDVKLDQRYHTLKGDTESRLALLQWCIDAGDILEWIKVQVDPELLRDMANSDVDDMATCQEKLNEAMDAKEGEVVAIGERFEAFASKLPASGRKPLLAMRKLVRDKWEELENVYNSMESNIDLIDKYQEAKEKFLEGQEQLKQAQALLIKAQQEGTKSELAEAEQALANLSTFTEDVAALAADASPLHKRWEEAPKKFFVYAVSTMNIGKLTLTHAEECLLIDNSDKRYWKVATTAGSFLELPSPLLKFPPPCNEFLTEVQSLEAGISQGRDRISTITKQQDSSVKKATVLADAEALLSLELDETFDSLRLSHEELLERCKLMIPDLLAEEDSITLEKVRAAELHWQWLCTEHKAKREQPYMEFHTWMTDVESRLISQSDLPCEVLRIRSKFQEPLQGMKADISARENQLGALEELREDFCDDVEIARERYALSSETCGQRAALVDKVAASLSEYNEGRQFAMTWLENAERLLEDLQHASTGHDDLKQQLDRCRELQDDAEEKEETFATFFSVGQTTSDTAQAWQDVLTAYMEQLKQVLTAELLQMVGHSVLAEEEQDDVKLVIDEIPDELVAISERFEAVVTAIRREEKRLKQQLGKSGRVHDLLDEVAAWLKESERIALQESASAVPANLDDVENHMDILQELEDGSVVQDALMMQALAAYEDFVGFGNKNSTDGPSVVAVLRERLDTFRDATFKRKLLLRDLYEKTEALERHCTEEMYFLASAEETAKHRQAPSLDMDQLNEQIAQHNEFHQALEGRQAQIDAVKVIGEALLSNQVADTASKDHHRASLTDLLTSNGHLLLQSEARKKQLSNVKEHLETFSQLLDPSTQWISSLEDQLYADGPPAVDAPTLKKQTERVEAHHQSLQEQSKQLAGILAAGQRLLLTLYMSSSSRVTITHNLKETNASTGDVVKEEAHKQESERTQQSDALVGSVGSNASALSGTISLGDIPAERFVVDRQSKGDETDGAVRIDVLGIAEDAVADGSASWVQKECIGVPKRYQAAAQSCVVRIRELATMKAHVDSFDAIFAPLMANLLELKAKASEDASVDGDKSSIAPALLQEQLDATKAAVKVLSEKAPKVSAVLESGRSVLDKHSVALDSLKEAIAKLSAHRGAVVLNAEALDTETGPGVQALHAKLADLQKLWDELNNRMQASHAELEATLNVSKDLNKTVEGLHEEISEVGELCETLGSLSSDKIQLTKQIEDLKAANRQLASVQTKAVALSSSTASSPAMKRSLSKLQQDCKDLEATLSRREKAIGECRVFLDTVESLNPWLSEKEAYIAALPTSNADLLEAFVTGVRAQEQAITEASTQASALGDDYGDLMDKEGYEMVASSLLNQYQALNVAAGSGFKNALGKIKTDSERCEHDSKSVVTATALPLTVTSIKAQQDRTQDLARAVESNKIQRDDLAAVLERLRGDGVNGMVVDPALGELGGLESLIAGTGAELEQRLQTLDTAASLVSAHEMASSGVSKWLSKSDDRLSGITEEISDNRSLLGQQAGDLKALIATVEDQQSSVSEAQAANQSLLDFADKHGAQESDMATVQSNIHKSQAQYDKLLQEAKSALVDVEAQLENVNQFEGTAQTLSDWLDEQLKSLDDARCVSGETMSAFEEKLHSLEAISDGIASREADKTTLWKSSLRIAEAKKKGRHSKQAAGTSVGEKASLVEQKWLDATALLEKRRQELDDALKYATATTGDIAQLEKWVKATRACIDKLPVAGCTTAILQKQQSDLELTKKELAVGELSLSEVSSKCQGMLSDESLQQRLEKAEEDLKSLESSVEGKQEEYRNGLETAEEFGIRSDEMVEKLSDIAEGSSAYLLKQPPASLEQLAVEQQATEALQSQVTDLDDRIAAVLQLADSMLQPVDGASREGAEEIQARRDELQGLLEQIKKDIDAQQKHLEDATRVARVFDQKCKDVEEPFAEMEKLLVQKDEAVKPQSLSADNVNGEHDLVPSSSSKKPNLSVNTLMSIIQELATKEPDLHGIQLAAEDVKKVCDPDEYATVDKQVEDIVLRWHELQREAMQRLGEMETAAKYAVGFQEKLEPFLEWLKDFEEMNSAPIGLTHKEIEAVFLDVQAMSDTMALQKADLQELWVAAEDLMDQSHAASGRVQQEMDRIQASFNKQATCIAARLEKVQKALHAATDFEHPFADLVNEKSALEVNILHPEPLTGSLEDSQQMLVATQEVHEKTTMFAPQVEAVHRAGENLLLHTECEQARKDQFNDTLEDFQAAWGVLQLRAGLRVEKLRSAIARIEVFVFNHLSPMLDWMSGVEMLVSPDRPILGDIDAMHTIATELEEVADALKQQEPKYVAADTTGRHLVKDVLDDPFVTEEQLIELNLRWEKIKSQLSLQQRRVADSLSSVKELDDQLQQALHWLNDSQSQLSGMGSVSSVELATVEAQLQEIQEFTSGLDTKFPEVRALLERGRKLLAADKQGRRTAQSDMLDELDQQCSDVLYQANERTVDIEASILALRGLQDAVSELQSSINAVDTRLADCESEAVSGDLPGVRAQLDIVKLLQEDMHHLQPRMDVLSKALRDAGRQDRSFADTDPQMKAIGELQRQWKLLWLRASQRQSSLEDVLGQLHDAEAAKNFDYNAWRDEFVRWLDEHNIRALDLFNWSDDKLRREAFVSGLEKCGHPMSRVEISRVADMFEPKGNGIIDYWAFAASLRPDRQVKFKHKPKNEAEQVDQEVRLAVSHCTCAKQFRVQQAGDARYMFGDSEMIRMVRILRTLVMVRVGGGWQNLDEFLNKHDPCRAQANAVLLKDLRARKLSGNAVKQDSMSSFMSHTQSSLHQRHNQSLQAASYDAHANVSSKSSGGRRQNVVTKRVPVEKGKPAPHVIDGDSSSPRIRRTYKVDVQPHSESCGHHQHQRTSGEYSPFGPQPSSALSSTESRAARQRSTSSVSPVAKQLTYTTVSAVQTTSTTSARLPGRPPTILSPPIQAPIQPPPAAVTASHTTRSSATSSPTSAAASSATLSPRSPKLKRKSSFSKIPVPKSVAAQSKIPSPAQSKIPTPKKSR
eukprot:scpid1069/ scgid3428/ Dystonin; 230 kDa bullous pemphigoid antigen; 230/240 kDa bullous pemphigoid antigen; Bullous pemphigoid antigen 1; Dystonia musculorum protein; Hemidesmosomal plaque protein